jgi:hypothetical protein
MRGALNRVAAETAAERAAVRAVARRPTIYRLSLDDPIILPFSS